MNISITVTAEDASYVDAFALATGWTDKSGVTKESWLDNRIGDFVNRRIVQGLAMAQSKTAQETYVSALKLASSSAVTAVSATPITVNGTDLKPVIGKLP